MVSWFDPEEAANVCDRFLKMTSPKQVVASQNDSHVRQVVAQQGGYH